MITSHTKYFSGEFRIQPYHHLFIPGKVARVSLQDIYPRLQGLQVHQFQQDLPRPGFVADLWIAHSIPAIEN